MSLDSTDKKILNMLLASGRISYTDIARAVDMKPPSVIDRVKKMEADGVIKGYSALVDYRKLGYDLTAMIGVTVDNPDHLDAIEHSLLNIDPCITECYHVTGDFTLMMKIITENTTTLSDFIKRLRAVPGVTKTNTLLIFSTMMSQVRRI